jgi:[ribosomal protein S18]-alanine N-acetyltransferase
MSARPSAWSPTLRWRTAQLADVTAMLALEQRAYSHPWTHGNFVDSVVGGHWIWLGCTEEFVRAYWLAMPVLDELHLLNLTVDPSCWGQGFGKQALTHLHERALQQQMREIWLEVRVSNTRAQHLYQREGYLTVGRRRGYYPGGPHGQGREDAYLMRRAVRLQA